jgi:hypothetical protein
MRSQKKVERRIKLVGIARNLAFLGQIRRIKVKEMMGKVSMK